MRQHAPGVTFSDPPTPTEEPKKARKRHNFLWLLFIIALLAPALYLIWNIVHQPPGNQLFMDATRPDDGKSFDIEAAEIVEDHLQVTVTYSGGCSEHIFDLYVEDQRSDMNRLLQLHHRTDDSCTQRVTEDLSFDLGQVIAQHDTPQIIFKIEGNGRQPEPVFYQQPSAEGGL